MDNAIVLESFHESREPVFVVDTRRKMKGVPGIWYSFFMESTVHHKYINTY